MAFEPGLKRHQAKEEELDTPGERSTLAKTEDITTRQAEPECRMLRATKLIGQARPDHKDLKPMPRSLNSNYS